jgi:hypothetical protein
MESSGQARSPANPWIFRAQLVLPFGFLVYAGLIVLWISRLMYVAWVLEDVFSASIGIALVAVPIFLFLTVMVNYVFWGLRKGRAPENASSP